MANQFAGEFAKFQHLDIKTIIEVMEQYETVPTPTCTPIYDGWLGLVTRAILVDTKLASRVYKLQTKWEAQFNAKRIEYTKTRKLRTPKWLSKEEKQAIKEFYRNCPRGYHIDHIIPLQGKDVSGLHILSNLQYLPAKDNLKKSNKYEKTSA